MTQSSVQARSAPTEYRGRLTELLATLAAELPEHGPTRWAWRLLGGGAVVALQRDESDRRVLRIARAERPLTAYGLTRWGHEVATFLKHLGATSWQSLPEEAEKGIAVRFLETLPRETRPGFARCTCGAELPVDQLWGTPRCPGCGASAHG